MIVLNTPRGENRGEKMIKTQFDYEHQLLVEEALLVIKQDVLDNDLTVIEGLLYLQTTTTLRDFVSKD